MPFHVLVGLKRASEAGRPARHPLAAVVEDVGLERGEARLAHLRAERADAVQAGDHRAVHAGMGNAPSAAVRPVHPNAVAHPPAEQLAARHPEQLRLGVEQRVLDRADPHRHHPRHRLARLRMQLGEHALGVLDALAHHGRGQALHHAGHAGGALVLVVLAPAHDTVLGGELDEMIVAPAGVAVARFDADYPHALTLTASAN